MTGAWRYHWDWATCRKIWHWYPIVGKAERAFKLTAPVCIRGAALAVPLLLPGAAFLPPVPHSGVVFSGPVLSGPAYAPYAAGYGSVFAPGFYGVPTSQSTTQELGAFNSDHNGLAAVPGAQELGQNTTPMLSGDVPHWLPDREVPGQSVPPTEVPEPASFMLLGAGLAIVMLRRWVQ